MAFKDHFSQQSDSYAASRPTYPAELFDFIASKCQNKNHAWDCATGTGQAAIAWAKHFAKVTATDASEAQIARANRAAENITYAVMPAEAPTFVDESLDLVSVAQALHWFKIEQFFEQVQRILKPGGLIATWTYALHTISPEIDKICFYYYDQVVGPYWPPERKLVEEKYANVTFPFAKVEVPTFHIELEYTCQQLIGYLRSWSATQRYINEKKANPLEGVEEELQAAWGNKREPKLVRWPITLLLGCK